MTHKHDLNIEVSPFIILWQVLLYDSQSQVTLILRKKYLLVILELNFLKKSTCDWWSRSSVIYVENDILQEYN